MRNPDRVQRSEIGFDAGEVKLKFKFKIKFKTDE
jgi:hypothetical protein